MVFILKININIKDIILFLSILIRTNKTNKKLL